jgi:hypothetical protein
MWASAAESKWILVSIFNSQIDIHFGGPFVPRLGQGSTIMPQN